MMGNWEKESEKIIYRVIKNKKTPEFTYWLQNVLFRREWKRTVGVIWGKFHTPSAYDNDFNRYSILQEIFKVLRNRLEASKFLLNYVSIFHLQ